MAKEFIYKKTKELGKLSDTTTVEVGHYKVDGKEMPDKIYLVNHFTRKNGSEDSKATLKPDFVGCRKIFLKLQRAVVRNTISSLHMPNPKRSPMSMAPMIFIFMEAIALME